VGTFPEIVSSCRSGR